MSFNCRAAFGSAVATALLVACGGAPTESTDNPPLAGGPELALVAPPLAEPETGSCVSAETKFEQSVEALAHGELMPVVVTFHADGGVPAQQVEALEALGLSGTYMQYTPIAGVWATPEQIDTLDALPGVRSVRYNAPMTLDDDVARRLTSVDRTIASPDLLDANGEPITGKGVTILVNDSGIDATHQDLTFGEKVVANASGYTNLRSQADVAPELGMLPFSPLEDVPNTDVLGSHGTHVAGIVAGSGALSDGQFAGVARGASLAGYGSGAALLVLDTIGGFDYAVKLLEERPELNLRIVSNSFGNTGDVGTCFDPDDPTNVVTKMLADRGVIVVFSAGNSGSGPGSITGNFKKAPWVIAAGNGEKSGLLAPSSSRGALINGVYAVEVDGETLVVEDRPTVVTPGTDYISTRAIAADPFLPLDAEADISNGDIPPQLVPFYTQKTGTSMAAPHLAGIVALILDANPDLTWREVKSILKQTATNMPGYEPWQVGAGFANAEAAVAMALAVREDYGLINHTQRGFFAEVGLGGGFSETIEVDFQPVLENPGVSFEVADDKALVLAQWTQPLGDPCTCAIVLIDPAGNEYGSGIALPLLGSSVAAVAPGMAGTWSVRAGGVGAVSGVAVDPLGVTNGAAGPSTLEIALTQVEAAAPVGLQDVSNHPLMGSVVAAVQARVVDGQPAGFQPDSPLIRAHFAEYLSAWGMRQTRSHTGDKAFADLDGAPAIYQAAAEVSTRPGALLLDGSEAAAPAILDASGSFEPMRSVTVEEALYGLVQVQGQETAALAAAGSDLFWVDADGNALMIVDADDVDPRYRGHVQVALTQNLITPVANGDGTATLSPTRALTRAQYADMATRMLAIVPFPT